MKIGTKIAHKQFGEGIITNIDERKIDILFLEHDYYNECCSIIKINNKYSIGKTGKLNDFLNA